MKRTRSGAPGGGGGDQLSAVAAVRAGQNSDSPVSSSTRAASSRKQNQNQNQNQNQTPPQDPVQRPRKKPKTKAPNQTSNGSAGRGASPKPEVTASSGSGSTFNHSPSSRTRDKADNVRSLPGDGATAALEGYDSSSSGSEVTQRLRDEPLSSVRLSPFNVNEATAKTLGVTLKFRETLTLIGQYDLWVKRGSISIMGATLLPSKRLHRVYAPSTHSLPTISCVSQPDAMIDVLSCRSGLRVLRDLSPLFGRIWNGKRTRSEVVTPADVSKKRSFSTLYKSSDDPKKRHLTKFEVDATWAIFSDSVSKPPRGKTTRLMACGPRATGKSSLCQYLINKQVTKVMDTSARGQWSLGETPAGVALLDLDTGHPMFCPPGQVSLCHFQVPWFGPSFTHPTVSAQFENRMIRTHHVGLVTLKGDPYFYIQCVLDLLKHYERLLKIFPSCPLVVNTPAWTIGIGLEVLADFMSSLGITILVCLANQLEPQKMFEKIAHSKSIDFMAVAPAPSDLTTRVSKELQTMQMMSYFHLAAPVRLDLKWYASPIHVTRPWVVSYAGENQAIHAIIAPCDHNGFRFLFNALEAAIVGVVVVEADPPATSPERMDRFSDDEASMNGKEQTEPLATQRCGWTHLPFIPTNDLYTPLNPSTSQSIGLALVRCIDIKTRTLHLSTPIPSSAIIAALKPNRKLVLVQSNFEIPEWHIQEEHFSSMAAERRLDRRFKDGVEGSVQARERPSWEEAKPWLRYEPGAESKAPENRVRRVDRANGLRDINSDDGGSDRISMPT